jgi:hypothetical protein
MTLDAALAPLSTNLASDSSRNSENVIIYNRFNLLDIY